MAALLPALLRLLLAGGGAAARGGLAAGRAAGPPLANFARAHPRAALVGGAAAGAGVGEAIPRVGQGFSQLGNTVNNAIEQIPIIGDDLAGGFDRLGGALGGYNYDINSGGSQWNSIKNDPTRIDDVINNRLWSRGINPSAWRRSSLGRLVERSKPQMMARAWDEADRYRNMDNFGGNIEYQLDHMLGGRGGFMSNSQGQAAMQDMVGKAKRGATQGGQTDPVLGRLFELMNTDAGYNMFAQGLTGAGLGEGGQALTNAWLGSLQDTASLMDDRGFRDQFDLQPGRDYIGWLDLLQQLTQRGARL
jgi:hypothetical protein